MDQPVAPEYRGRWERPIRRYKNHCLGDQQPVDVFYCPLCRHQRLHTRAECRGWRLVDG